MRRAATSSWSRWRSPAGASLRNASALMGSATSTSTSRASGGGGGSARACISTTAPLQRAAKAKVAVARRKKSLLVDGNNVLYHFYNPLTAADSDGVQREAVNGLIQLLQRMDKTHLPEHICVFFDSKRKPTTRKLIDPTYKSLRKPTPQSLGSQLGSAAGVLSKGGVNCITFPGFEADDLIASYTEAYVAAGYEVLVVSNDNDFLQLARGTSVLDADVKSTQSTTADSTPSTTTDGTTESPSVATLAGYVELYQPNKRRYLRERHLQSRFGLPHARLIPAYLALVGTRWGKIQKVEHMTEERAVELLTKYDSLPKLLRSLNEIDDPKLRKSLKHAISSIETSHRIAKLNDRIALPVALEDLESPQLHQLQVNAKK